MPGILPMKVIKVGQSAQSRIAQACDRCRSKKIRCDGVRPTCTQCANVGFECRTSDKLSRRAFPRGYTESLEERVRVLECEVRELKDLLDEKDEKIDMLSKMHENNPQGRRAGMYSLSPSSPTESRKDWKDSTSSSSRDDTFRVHASQLLLGVENSDSYFMGPSSGRAFLEAFKRRIQEVGKPCSDFNPEAFLHIQGTPPLTLSPPDQSLGVPPRIFSDRCVNIYFQEWAPLFPVLHKPTFLDAYGNFATDATKIKCNYKTAQLYLVFSIAGLSSDCPDVDQIALCEQQWTRALDSLVMENTMGTLQCLILAMMYCMTRADYKRLQHYRGIAISLSYRLGLHQSQKRFSFGALTIETRKRVFWTLYTLDCFTAATLGLPRLLKDAEIEAEYPSDTDDEYVTEDGFKPTLPGESTRLSSALALFRASRILACVLEKNYPASTAYELSLQQMSTLDDELGDWYRDLPNHLRLNFVQDKPSTDVTGSRSPLLGLVYYYIRMLIFRPAVGSSLGPKAAPALMSIADSSKHVIQIIQLLEERNMIFSFCANKADLLTLCGLTMLYQVLEVKQDSKLMREYERLVNSTIKILDREKAPGSWDFKRIAGRLVSVSVEEPSNPTPPASASSREGSMASPAQHVPSSSFDTTSPYSLNGHPGGTVNENDLHYHQDRARRMTMPNPAGQKSGFYNESLCHSFDNAHESHLNQREYASMSQASRLRSQEAQSPPGRTNLDYLSLSNTPSQSGPMSPPHSRMIPPSLTGQQHHHHQHRQHQEQQQHQRQQQQQAETLLTMPARPLQAKVPPSTVSGPEWEVMLGQMDGGLNNVYDAIYGGQPYVNESQSQPPPAVGQAQSQRSDWSPNSWDLSNISIDEFHHSNPGDGPQSVLSMSDESLSSGEEIAPSELGLSLGSVGYGRSMMEAGGVGGGHDGLMVEPLNTFASM